MNQSWQDAEAIGGAWIFRLQAEVLTGVSGRYIQLIQSTSLVIGNMQKIRLY